jgi:hypothetical protein
MVDGLDQLATFLRPRRRSLLLATGGSFVAMLVALTFIVPRPTSALDPLSLLPYIFLLGVPAGCWSWGLFLISVCFGPRTEVREDAPRPTESVFGRVGRWIAALALVFWFLSTLWVALMLASLSKGPGDSVFL